MEHSIINMKPLAACDGWREGGRERRERGGREEGEEGERSKRRERREVWVVLTK